MITGSGPLRAASALAMISIGSAILYVWSRFSSMKRVGRRAFCVMNDFTELIGETPLVEIKCLSEATGCRILAKCEFLNPGGSIKDRTALQIVEEAEAAGLLRPGDTIYEGIAIQNTIDRGRSKSAVGTAGSTGVSLALIARSRGYVCHIFMPDDQAQEKVDLLRSFGAIVEQVRPVSIVNRGHFVNRARAAAEEHNKNSLEKHEGTRGFFADQFENLANFHSHYLHTAPEIWRQAGGTVDACVCAAGTGGTIAGISRYLKEQNARCKSYLIDPPGSSLFHKVNSGVLYTAEEAEGKRLRNPFDTVTEGIGINRLTANFKAAVVDKAFKGSDQEAVSMGYHILRHEGLFVGSSSSMNCVGAVKAARELGPGHTIVTILCDSGQRHLSKFYNQDYLSKYSLSPAFFDRHDLSFVS